MSLARDPLQEQMRPGPASAAGERTMDDAAQARPTRILQRIDHPSPQEANRQALAGVAAGADGLAIVFADAPNAFGRGLPAQPDALAMALREVPLSRLHLRIDPHPGSRASIDWLARQLVVRRISLDRIDVSFGIDPAAIFAGTGWLRMSIEAMMASMPQSLGHYFALGMPGVLLEADGRVYHNAGATDAQELGAMIASAIGYLRMFEGARQPALYAAAHIGFAVALSQDRAASMRKIAALRQLWARVLDSYSVPPMAPIIHAETSWRMTTALSPTANMARGMAAAAAAIDAGVDTLAMLPPGLAGSTTQVGDAAVLETLFVLAREGGAAGSSATEDAQTAQLAEDAWQELRRIEEEGGILRSILDGRLQARVLDARAAHVERIRDAHGAAIGRTLHPAPEGPARDPRAPSGTTDASVFCRRLEPVRVDQLMAEAEADSV